MNNIKSFFAARTLREVVLVYGGAVANGGALFLLNIILARTLPKESFAAFSLAVLVLGTVAELSDFGLNAGFLRFAPYYVERKEENKLKQLVKTVWNWRVSLSVILTLGGVLFSGLIARYIFRQPSIEGLLRFSFVGVGGVILLGFITTYLQATQRFIYTSLLQGAKGVVRFVLIALLLVGKIYNLYVILAVYIGIPWLLLLLTYQVLPGQFSRVQIEEEVRNKLHSQLARFSLWITMWSLSAIVSSRIDDAMVSGFLDLKEVANFTVAFQFVFVYSLALQSISAVLTPKINKLTTKRELFAYSKKIFVWMLPVVICLASIIYPSQFVISLLFGNKYLAAMPVYLILSYSMLVNFLTIPLSLIISAFNKTHLIAFSGFLELMVNIIFNLVLIPRYGIIGAAITFAVAIAVSQIYCLVISWYLHRYKEIVVA